MADKSVVRELVTLWGFDIDQKPIQELDAGINTLKSSLKAVGIVAAAATGAIGYLLNEAGKQEQTNVAFETMIGNTELARKTLDELYSFAATTPFTIPGIEQSAKMLLGMGIEVNKLLPTMKALGDVSAGLSVPMGRLALNFGQVKAQGKLTGRELRDFAIAGVPLLDELAKQLGKSKEEIQGMVSAGDIGFPEVEKAFVSMSSEGGRFNNLMIKQSKTLHGLISNIKDVGIIFAREMGEELLPMAKEIANQFVEWFEANEKIIKSDMKKFLKNLVTLLKDLVGMIATFKRAADGLVGVFGGWNTVLKAVFKTFTAIMGIGILASIGLMTKGVIGLAVAWRTMGNAALIAQMKMAAIPIAIGAIVVALALIAEDILAFSQGRDSVFGRMMGGLDTLFASIKEKFGIFGEIGQMILTFFLTPIRAAVNGFKSILTMVDILRGKVGFMEGLKDIGGNLANAVGFGTDSARGVFGISENVGRAADQVSRDNTPIKGLGGRPFKSNEEAKNVSVQSENTINLNLEGLDAKTAQEMITGNLKEELGLVFREAVREGESQVER